MKHHHSILFPLAVVLLNIGVSRAVAANILWNEGVSFSSHVVENENSGFATLALPLTYLGEGGHESIYMDLEFTVTRTVGIRRQFSGTDIDLGRGHKVIVASPGETISSETIADDSRILITNYDGYKWSEFETISYLATSPFSIYLGFETTVDGTGSDVDSMQKLYGWFELTATNYELKLENFCLDLTGRPVTVGVRPTESIPEPATGSLALLGVALLLRRRRFVENNSRESRFPTHAFSRLRGRNYLDDIHGGSLPAHGGELENEVVP